MLKLFAFFLKPNTLAIAASPYFHYRKHNTPRITALIFCILKMVFVLLFNTQSSAWQKVLHQQKRLYPHINSKRPKLGDLLRYPLQTAWLVLNNTQYHRFSLFKLIKKHIATGFNLYRKALYKILDKPYQQIFKPAQRVLKTYPRVYFFCITLMAALSIVLIMFSITRFFNPMEQLIFLLILWFTAASVMELPFKSTNIILALLSIIATMRYLWWRYSTTLIWDSFVSEFFGVLLILAETYVAIVLVLGYFQSIWPLNRMPVSLDENIDSWPEVDVFFTTYDEDISVLKPGIYAALGMDWPQDKLNIYILDDGARHELKAFANEVGINYIARKDNLHAKAGNVNHALKLSRGKFVAMFDCDFIPTCSFLQMTIGWFLKDKKLGLVQTPHYFFSHDPFEKNLKTSENMPNESQLFYSVIQDGNDTWNATYFCGSAGVFRRTALEENNGMSVGCVTEDALTSLNLQRKGYSSAYIPIPLAAGQATDNMVDHLGQRIRWARGMAQILRLNNPLLGKGLTLPQRLCYLNATLHFFSGIPRLIFFVAPIAFLLFGGYIFYAPALMVMLYAMPHLIHSIIANSKIQGQYRHFLWNEIYETVMSYYIAIPTTMALINPKLGKFNVTAKGKLTTDNYADWSSAKPYVILAALNLLGILVGFAYLLFTEGQDTSAILITSSWAVYNLVILGGVLGAHIEAKQIRKSPRVSIRLPAALKRNNGHTFVCSLIDYSDMGVGIKLKSKVQFNIGEEVTLYLKKGSESAYFKGRIQHLNNDIIGLKLLPMGTEQWIDFIQFTFARCDTWSLKKDKYTIEHPLKSMKEVFKLSLSGYINIMPYTPIFIHLLFTYSSKIWRFISSFLPQKVQQKNFDIDMANTDY